jgi:DNA repair protein RadC
MHLLEKRLRKPGGFFNSPSAVQQYLTLNLAGFEREVFSALWLDAQHRLITAEHLFAGTLTQTSVYPREVARRCLQTNAASVIFAHNHPGGCAEPSKADLILTRSLMDVLSLFGVQVLDHFIVAGSSTVSLANMDLLGKVDFPSEEMKAERPKRKQKKARATVKQRGAHGKK